MMASDKKRQTPQYWEVRLHRMGLGMDEGTPHWLSYGHRVSDLDFDGNKTYPTTDKAEGFHLAEAVS